MGNLYEGSVTFCPERLYFLTLQDWEDIDVFTRVIVWRFFKTTSHLLKYFNGLCKQRKPDKACVTAESENITINRRMLMETFILHRNKI